MSTPVTPPSPQALTLPQRTAARIAQHFVVYNGEFKRITQRAAVSFADCRWTEASADAMARIELYEQHVAYCVGAITPILEAAIRDRSVWDLIKQAYDQHIARQADSDLFRTFYNSVTRDIFSTVGVNAEVEFCTPSPAHGSGSVPMCIYPIAGALRGAIDAILSNLSFMTTHAVKAAAVQHITLSIGRHFHARLQSAGPECIEVIDALFYRGQRASIVGRLLSDSTITPLVIEFSNSSRGIRVENVLLMRHEIGRFFGFTRSYFQVDLPVVGAAVTLLRSFMPHKATDELYTILGRAKQGKTERYFALRRHLSLSIDTFVHAPGQRGLVMMVFTLPSHDLVFKIIRDRFGPPKNTSRAEVMACYEWVFRHERADRLVDAQEFRQLRLPLARFMPALLDELLTEGSETCVIDGQDLIIKSCYIERRLRPLDVFVREADPAASEAAIIDYGNALRDLAANNIFPGDLLLKNFGVTKSGRVIFYDYDELCEVTDCQFRDPPTAQSDEDDMSAEPWYYVGPRDVFPSQWLPFLGMSDTLKEVFLHHHAEVLTAQWWREQKIAAAELSRPAALAAPALANGL